MKATTCVALAVLIASCGGGRRLEPRFVAVHNAMSAMGMAQTGPINEGSLPEGAHAQIELNLQAGQCYTFVALGSSSVSDIDIRIVGEGDEEVGRDVTHDRQAAAQVCPDRTGPYQVVVAMTEGSGGYLVSSWSGAPGATASTSVRASGPTLGSGNGPGTCQEPYEITLGQPVTGDTTGGPNSTQGPCAQGNAPERVYSLNIDQRTHLTAALESSFDGALYLLRQCGDMSSMIECNDDAGDTEHSRIEATVEAGNYFLVVDGYGTAAGAYSLVVSAQQLRPISAVCNDASRIVAGRSQSGTTAGSADYFQATCAGGARAPDRVFRLDVPARSRLRIRQTSDHDGALYVRRTCTDANSEILCNDDFGTQRESLVSGVVDPGSYYVYADGFSGSGNHGAEGNFSLTTDLVPVRGTGVQGDACASPNPMPGGAELELDTMAALDDTAGSCGGQGGADVMYRLDIQNRTRVEVEAQRSEHNAVMYIQRTCGDASTEVVCTQVRSSAQSGSQNARIDTVLNPGQYVLVFDGADAEAFGKMTVQVRTHDLAAVERSCRSAPMLRPGRTVNGSTRGGQDLFQATCADHATSADKVYRIRVTRRSRVRVDMTSDYDGALHLRRDCADPSSELACNDDHDSDNRRARVEAVVNPGTYYLVVDGYSRGNDGSFSLDLDLSRP